MKLLYYFLRHTTRTLSACKSHALHSLLQDESSGLLDITVKYKASSESASESPDTERGLERTHVNLSLGILRASGLKVRVSIQ